MGRRLLGLLTALGVAVGVAAVDVSLAPPTAALPGVQYVLELSATNSSPVKEEYSFCPGSKWALAGGAGIGGTPSNGNGRLHVTSMYPGVSSVFAGVAEEGNGMTDSYPYDWQHYTWLVCVDYIPGLEYKRASTGRVDAPSARVTTEPCPAGKKVIGLGGNVVPKSPASGSQAQALVHLEDLFPSSDLRTVTATGAQKPGTTIPYLVGAYAVCAPITDLALVSRVVSTGSTSQGYAEVTCPPGTTVYGSGVQISNEQNHVVLDDLGPAFLSSNRAVANAYEDRVGTTSNWSITSYAICHA